MRGFRGGCVRRSGILVLLLVLVSGCFTRTVFIESCWPVIEIPSRPEVSQADWTDRERQLLLYTIILETRIKFYNHEAEVHNREYGYEIEPGSP